MIPTIETLRAGNLLSAADEHFATTLARIAGETTPEAILGAALLFRSVGDSHVCLDLDELAGHAPKGPEGTEPFLEMTFPQLDQWCDLFARSPLTSCLNGTAPLVLDGSRLYLQRHYTFETGVASAIRALNSATPPHVDEPILRDGLQRLFPDSERNPNWQRVAATLAILRSFTVISGGPGTGKTWTVARILALLAEQNPSTKMAVALLAPTGKAAARLRDSIRRWRATLPVSELIRASIPDQAMTIHRALAVGANGLPRRGADNPLIADTVIVDEASMVDLGLMHHLLAAIPSGCRLILLGDRDQLASVEAGSVLADLCDDHEQRLPQLSIKKAEKIRSLSGDDVTGEGDNESSPVIYLRESHRFSKHTEIGKIAQAVLKSRSRNDAKSIVTNIEDSGGDVFLTSPDPSLPAVLRDPVVSGYSAYINEGNPTRKLELLENFRILTAHRHGPRGVTALNQQIEQILSERGVLDLGPPGYDNRPLLVTRNDRSTGLYNGDIGIVVLNAAETRKAVFPADTEDGGSRLISLARLPAHETAFATTVHKSQGSEFAEVVFVLPDAPSPVLTRELLYTAITRAGTRLQIIGTPEILIQAALSPTRRRSGLRTRLRH